MRETLLAGVIQIENGQSLNQFKYAHDFDDLRYSPSSLSVEVISVPATRADGPAILDPHSPDEENTTVGPRYFESMSVDAITYPTPFAKIAEIISAGCRERFFMQRMLK